MKKGTKVKDLFQKEINENKAIACKFNNEIKSLDYKIMSGGKIELLNIEDKDGMSNSWYYLALKGELEFARILNKTDDIQLIEGMMSRMKTAFNKRFWTGKEYRSPNYKGETDDRGQALAVLAGFAIPEQYPLVLEVLKKERHASPYMEKYVGEALFVMGYPKVALQRTRERFADMVNYPDCTTLWEAGHLGEYV